MSWSDTVLGKACAVMAGIVILWIIYLVVRGPQGGD
jgi:hypothetical protein